MPQPKNNRNQVGLGRAIINRKQKDARQPKESHLYTTDFDSSGRFNSVTQERDLDEFLNTAQLAGTEFTAEKQNVKIIQAPGVGNTSAHNPFLLNAEEERETLQRHLQHKAVLRVPRRPPWTKNMTAAQLERQERDAFLDWRRSLAQVQEAQDLLLTPFERNLEVWRQLWRVLERSHLVVQIVDARNPLRFRCEDLETYVQDVEGHEGEHGTGKGKRNSLLLINKSDLLTREQRKLWADYFDNLSVRYAFYSAAHANALQEAEQLEEPSDDRHWAVEGKPSVTRQHALSEADEAQESSSDSRSSSDGEAQAEGGDQSNGDSQQPASQSRLGQPADDDDDDESTDNSDSERGGYHPLDEEDAQSESDLRIRVLSVHELEALFSKLAPDLSVFVDKSGATPPKLVVGLVGYPNVGKSSTINSLVGAKKVSVSSTPGKTKHFQTIHLSDNMVLCDCPGLVFPQFATTKAELVCDGVLPIDQMREYTGPVSLLTRRVPREILEATYGLTIRDPDQEDGRGDNVTAEDLLVAYAVARGFARAGQGNPDEARAARYVLKDYVNAKLLFCHPPPGTDTNAFNAESRARAMARLHAHARKPAPATRVPQYADTFVDGGAKARSVDRAFFGAAPGTAPRPYVQGTARSGAAFSRARMYPHQNTVADDGTAIDTRYARVAALVNAAGATGKKHHKGSKRQKQRSGKGYD